MNKLQTAQLHMHERVLAYLGKCNDDLQDLRGMNALVDELKTNVEELLEQRQLQEWSTKGCSERKLRVKNELVEEASILSGFFKWASQNPHLEHLAALSKTHRTIARLKQESLLVYAEEMKLHLIANSRLLFDLGYPSDRKQAFIEGIDHFRDEKHVPREAIKKRKLATAAVANLIKGTQQLLTYRLDLIVQANSHKYPELTSGYELARKVQKPKRKQNETLPIMDEAVQGQLQQAEAMIDVGSEGTIYKLDWRNLGIVDLKRLPIEKNGMGYPANRQA